MHTVSGSVSLAVRRSFHPSLTVLSTIGHGLVFSLGGWSPQIQPRFLVPRPTRVSSPSEQNSISHTGLSPPPVRRSRRVPLCRSSRRAMPQLNPTTPQRRKPPRFRLFPLRSPLLRESHLISLPLGTEMFQFPRLAPALKRATRLSPRQVAPFGYPRIYARLQLPEAFRSLPRPSSPVRT